MADIEEKVVLTVDTGNSQKTVKGLKDEIASLKDTILNLDKGSEEYAEAVQKLQADQRQLNEVMALTKKEAVALDGSYDALTHQMSLLKKEWRATADVARRTELGEQIEEINQQLKEMDASVGNFQRNVGNYVSHWEGMPEVTKDFGTAMREMNEQIEPTKAKFESVQKVASGLASGFAAVQGAAALLGIENENLEKTLVKVQAAMALAQGIGGVGDLVEGLGKAKVAFQDLGKSVKAVSATMGKIGWIAVITAVVAAIALVTSKIREKKKAVDELDDSLKKLEKRNTALDDSYNERSRQLEREIKLIAAQGATEEEILKKRLEYNQLYLDSAKKNYDEAQKIYLGLRDSLSMGIKGVTQEDVDKAKEVYDAANAAYKEYAEKRKDILNDITIAQLEASKKTGDTQTVTLDDIEIEDADIEISGKSKDKALKGNAESRSNFLISLAEREYARKVELNRMSEESDADKADREYQLNLELQEKKLELLRKYQEEAYNSGDTSAALELAQEIADQEVEIERTKYDEIKRLGQQSIDDRQAQLTKMSQTFEVMGNVMDGVYSLMESKAKENGEISEGEAKKLKNIQKAQAWISALNGAIQAYSAAMSLGVPVGPIVGGINAAAVLAMGRANVKAIDQTSMAGTVTTTTATIIPHSSSYQSDMPFTYTKQVTGAQEVDALNAVQNIKVWISETDLMEAGKRVEVRESESSF